MCGTDKLFPEWYIHVMFMAWVALLFKTSLYQQKVALYNSLNKKRDISSPPSK